MLPADHARAVADQSPLAQRGKAGPGVVQGDEGGIAVLAADCKPLRLGLDAESIDVEVEATAARMDPECDFSAVCDDEWRRAAAVHRQRRAYERVCPRDEQRAPGSHRIRARPQ